MRISDWSSDVCSSDLLRLTPPAPRRLAFPAIRLLAGLKAPEETPARTPWWLLLLRLLIVTLIILALAQPLLNPAARLAGSGPVVLRSEEHTSELQALMRNLYNVFFLKKKTKQKVST